MIKPLKLECEDKVALYSGNRTENIEPYYTARYELENGEKAQFIVNYTDEPIKIKLPENIEAKLYTSSEECSLQKGEFIIKERSVAAITA